MQRTALERLSVIVGVGAVGGAFYHYVLFAVTARSASGLLDAEMHWVVDGKATAPFQYRVLVPRVIVWLSDHTDLSIGQATTIVYAASLAVGVALGVAVLGRSGLRLWALPVLGYCAFMLIGPILFPKAETLTAFACVTGALIALARPPDDDRWWSPSVAWATLAFVAIVLIGCRTDLLVALAAGFATRWWQRRDRADLVVAGLLALVGATATVALVRVYPDAHYPPGIHVVELSYNLDALSIVVLATFLAPALGPLVLLSRPGAAASHVKRTTIRHLPLIMMVATEVVATFVVGHVEEVRLQFPMSFALAWVGVDLWRAALLSLDLVDAPVP